MHPLTSSQREVWFDQLLHAEVPPYNIGGWVHLPGPIDSIGSAALLMVKRRDALRPVLVEGVPAAAAGGRAVARGRAAARLLRGSRSAGGGAGVDAGAPGRAFTLIDRPLCRYDLIV